MNSGYEEDILFSKKKLIICQKITFSPCIPFTQRDFTFSHIEQIFGLELWLVINIYYIRHFDLYIKKPRTEHFHFYIFMKGMYVQSSQSEHFHVELLSFWTTMCYKY